MLKSQLAREYAPGTMKATRIKAGRRGLTLVEALLVIAVIVGLAVAVFLPALSKAKPHHRRPSCVNNLKALSLSFRIWANDNNDLYPMKVPEAQGGALQSATVGNIVRVFQVMSNELSLPKSVICPADSRPWATNWNTLSISSISYFVGLDAADTRPNTILSGDRDLAESGQLLRGTAHLTTNRPVAWHKLLHKEGGNIALADGSVQQTTTDTLRPLLTNTGDATNRVLFPQ